MKLRWFSLDCIVSSTRYVCISKRQEIVRLQSFATSLIIALGVMLAWPISLAAKPPYAILVPGAGGNVPADFLVRNKSKIRNAGISLSVTTSTSKAITLSKQHSAKFDVFIIGMSRGGLQVADALLGGAKVKGAVFVSAGYARIIPKLGSANILPATLSVHHVDDQCKMTRFRPAKKFAKWAAGKVKLVAFNNTGSSSGSPCGPKSAHGFYRKDTPPIEAIIQFIRANST